MRKLLVVGVFMLAALVYASAQQPGGTRLGSGAQSTSPGAQSTSPSTQTPDATQSQRPGSGTGAQSGAQDATHDATGAITEGCLGGSNPNYTITDKAGTTYKLNIPPGADASSLAPHVGESVAVMGAVNNGSSKNASIDVSRIARGSSSNCPGSKATGTQPPPK